MDDLQADVTASSPDAAAPAVADSSPAGDSGQSQGGVTAPEAQPSDPFGNDDVFKGIPTADELDKQQNVPYAAGLKNVVGAYERVKETYAPWKDVIDKIGDPAQALVNHELASRMFSPVEGKPDQYSTVPYWEYVEQQSPGFVDQAFADLLALKVPDHTGQVDTLVRHLYRSHGLNPDNIETYRAMENGTLPSIGGGASPEDLAIIPQPLQDAFKSMLPTMRADVVSLLRNGNESDRITASGYLQNAQAALETSQFKQAEEKRQEEAYQAQMQQLEQDVQVKGDEAVHGVISEMRNSIYQNLSSQIKFSSNELENKLHLIGIMNTLDAMRYPQEREIMMNELKEAGIAIDSNFDQLINQLDQGLRNEQRFLAYGDAFRAAQAKASASQARQFLTVKFQQIALKLAKPTANALATNVQNVNLGATARAIPNGNIVPQGPTNPFFLPDNIKPGSPEAAEHYQRVARERGLMTR